MTQITLPALFASLALSLPACAQVEQGQANADFQPAFANQTRAPALDPSPVTVDTFATGLSHPWGISPLPEGGWLVTERPGRLRVLGADGSLSEPVTGLPAVDARRQGGLLDVAVGPDFASDRRIYWTFAKAVSGGTVTAAARGVLSADLTQVTQVEEIFMQSPPSTNAAPWKNAGATRFGRNSCARAKASCAAGASCPPPCAVKAMA